MLFRQLFDPESSTYTYLLADEQTHDAVIIDPVREQFDRDSQLIEDLGLTLRYVLETHVHADRITSAGLFRQRMGARTVLSANAGVDCADLLVSDGDPIRFGTHVLEVRTTPGHTDGDVVYVLGDRSAAFTGDTVLVRGCGRTDFQQGDPRALYRSVHDKVFTLPDHTLLYPAHDYRGRSATTVGEEKALNPRLGGGRSEDEFVAIMQQLNLPMPKKIDVSVPANSRCGYVEGDPDREPHRSAWAPIEFTPTGIPEVGPEWVASGAGDDVLFVDVRQPAEWTDDVGHIDRARLVPLAQLAATAADWDRGARIVTICRSGGRSGRAAEVLEALGFHRVASMRGGMLAWKRARLPAVHAA